MRRGTVTGAGLHRPRTGTVAGRHLLALPLGGRQLRGRAWPAEQGEDRDGGHDEGHDQRDDGRGMHDIGRRQAADQRRGDGKHQQQGLRRAAGRRAGATRAHPAARVNMTGGEPGTRRTFVQNEPGSASVLWPRNLVPVGGCTHT